VRIQLAREIYKGIYIILYRKYMEKILENWGVYRPGPFSAGGAGTQQKPPWA